MKQPTFAWPVATGSPASGHVDLAVVVAEVAVGGDRPEVHPLADVGVAEEPLVVLVRVAVDDRRLDLAADPAVGAERHAAAEVGPEELGVAADVAGPLDPGERLNQAPASIGDRPVRRVEDGVRVDPRRLVDEEPVGRPDEGGAGEVPVAQPELALGREVAARWSAFWRRGPRGG